MASLSFTLFLSLPRCQRHWASSRNALSFLPTPLKLSQLEGFRLVDRKWSVKARKKAVEGLTQDASLAGNEVVSEEKKKKKTASTARRTRKKVIAETPEESSDLEASSDVDGSDSVVSDSAKEAKKTRGRTRKKAVSASSASSEEIKTEKKVSGRRKTKQKDTDGGESVSESEAIESDEIEVVKAEKRVRGRRKTVQKDTEGGDLVSEKIAIESDEVKVVKTEKKGRGRRKTVQKDSVARDLVSEDEVSDIDEPMFGSVDVESEEELNIEEGEDISYTYGWPPLVCCFGAAQHAFVPSGRPANRLLNYEIHERMKDAYWAPEKFVRSPGSSAGSVAIALASLGGKVAFMGKLGADDYGNAMLYYMNFNNVQTRSVKIDSKRATAATQMKISKRACLRVTCVKPCAEDSLTKPEINIDVLKEAKIFYCSTHSLLDPNMRSTTLHAIKISKQLGGLIFYDLNLPMPLWHSREEAKAFIQRVWNLADIIEVTKQELEFLLGIIPTEEFDTKNNNSSKFKHYEPEVIAPLWHENLKVLFVTNGTSKIHYYTAEHNGAVKGMEDAPLTPYTSDMSASGDGIIAGILRLLAVQMDLVTDKGYLEHTIKFAIDCGVVDQWALGRVTGFPPKEDMVDEVDPDSNGIRSITEREYRTVKPVS